MDASNLARVTHSERWPLRVLVAGSPLTRDRSLTDHLSASGLLLTMEEDGARAAELCLQGKVQVALLSKEVPPVSGLEIAEALQPSLNVGLVLSAPAWSKADLERALRMGVSHCLLEPLSVAATELAIRTAFFQVGERLAAQARLNESSVAALSSRRTGVAIGVLMSSFHLNERLAYELMRKLARRQSRKIADVASNVVTKSNDLNSLLIELQSGSVDA